eukprot:6461989-Amphidinium_carterae.2
MKTRILRSVVAMSRWNGDMEVLAGPSKLLHPDADASKEITQLLTVDAVRVAQLQHAHPIETDPLGGFDTIKTDPLDGFNTTQNCVGSVDNIVHLWCRTGVQLDLGIL